MSNLSALAGGKNLSIRPQIEVALIRASKATGVDFKYLLDTAIRESNLKTGAKSKSSSATGLFQFIDETWLSTLKEFGPKFGLKQYADAIEKTASGRHKVSSASRHREILALRKDPGIAAMMAGAYASKSATYLKGLLGREPRQGEVYIAHFLGIKGGGDLISAATQKPNVSGAALFPKAARSNPSIFFNKRGQARSVRQVYHGLISKHSNNIASYKSLRPQVARIPGQPLKLNHGLLKNLGRPMPVENALVANAEYTRSNVQTAAILARPSPLHSQSVDEYRPSLWPAKPQRAQMARYPVAGPGSIGYEINQDATPITKHTMGSLVSADKRPFAAFSKLASSQNPNSGQAQQIVSSKPSVLAAPLDGEDTGNWSVPVNTATAKPLSFGQIFVNVGENFFTMKGKK